MTEEEKEDKTSGINWPQVVGGALAAVSSAVLLSTLGVAGTIIGAAAGSVIASVGGALYTRTIDVSRQQVAAQAAALRRVAEARLQVSEAVRRGGTNTGTLLRLANRDLSEAEAALEEAQHPDDPERGGDTETAVSGSGPWLRRLPWKRIAVVAASVFAVAMLVITGFELLTGRAVSTYTGGSDSSTGSTVPGLAKGSTQKPGKPTQQPTNAPTPEASERSTGPTTGPTEAPSTPSSTPTSSPTQEPTLTPEPTETPELPSGSPSPSLSDG